ncbi:hypothetical protein [Nitratireductor basaltis]|uniref:Uncharacterized protein n=1 Tax=Nitratireductor basaltis TaxID=472175 RepID=A0A084U6X2_9HYPH|nr:hypothetical protein [Nitratireductor basaltis]KFB08708.1 hypothetical protein EL18_02962 [Nitratireductor basaltis]
MPWNRNTIAAGALALAAFFTASASGVAGDRADALVYADGYGNLVIHAASGFKRIIVGEGHRLDAVVPDQAEEPEVVYLDDTSTTERSYRRRCPYGVLVKGRSYMYGLPDNALPVLRADCP